MTHLCCGKETVEIEHGHRKCVDCGAVWKYGIVKDATLEYLNDSVLCCGKWHRFNQLGTDREDGRFSCKLAATGSNYIHESWQVCCYCKLLLNGKHMFYHGICSVC